jgi:hypothetical protein
MSCERGQKVRRRQTARKDVKPVEKEEDAVEEVENTLSTNLGQQNGVLTPPGEANLPAETDGRLETQKGSQRGVAVTRVMPDQEPVGRCCLLPFDRSDDRHAVHQSPLTSRSGWSKAP